MATPREEVRTPLGYSLDAVVDFEGREVAVEVDGPSHFVGRAPSGAALERAGEGERGASSPAVCVARPGLSSRPSGSEGVKGHWAVPRWP